MVGNVELLNPLLRLRKRLGFTDAHDLARRLNVPADTIRAAEAGYPPTIGPSLSAALAGALFDVPGVGHEYSAWRQAQPGFDAARDEHWGRVPEVLREHDEWATWRINSTSGVGVVELHDPHERAIIGGGRRGRTRDFWQVVAEAQGRNLYCQLPRGIVCVEIDGELDDWTTEALASLGTYAEAGPILLPRRHRSPLTGRLTLDSGEPGTTVRAFVRGHFPLVAGYVPETENVYAVESQAWVPITGNRVDGSADEIADCQEALSAVWVGLYGTK